MKFTAASLSGVNEDESSSSPPQAAMIPQVLLIYNHSTILATISIQTIYKILQFFGIHTIIFIKNTTVLNLRFHVT